MFLLQTEQVELQEKYVAMLSAEKYSDESEYTQDGQFLHSVGFTKAAISNT